MSSINTKIKGDAKQFKRELGWAEKIMQNFVRRVKSAVIAIGTYFAIRWSLGGLQAAVESFKQFEVSNVRLQQVLKATGHTAGFSFNELSRLSSIFQNLTGKSDELVRESMAIIATFRNIRDDEFIRAQRAALDLSVALKTDLRGATLQISKALNDPIRGITNLSRVGVLFTNQQRELISQLQNSGRVMEAQRVILEELEQEFGGVAEAAGNTAAMGIERFWNEVEDLSQKLSSELVPELKGLNEILKVVLLSANSAVDAFIEWEKRTKAVSYASQLVVEGMLGMVAAFTSLSDVTSTVISFILKGWDSMVSGTAVAVQTVIDTFKHMGKVVVGTFKWMGTQIGEFMFSLVNNMQSMFNTTLTNAKIFLGKMRDVFTKTDVDFTTGWEGLNWDELKAGKFTKMPEIRAQMSNEMKILKKQFQTDMAELGASAISSPNKALGQFINKFADARNAWKALANANKDMDPFAVKGSKKENRDAREVSMAAKRERTGSLESLEAMDRRMMKEAFSDMRKEKPHIVMKAAIEKQTEQLARGLVAIQNKLAFLITNDARLKGKAREAEFMGNRSLFIPMTNFFRSEVMPALGWLQKIHAEVAGGGALGAITTGAIGSSVSSPAGSMGRGAAR